MTNKIWVVVPTIRPESIAKFKQEWSGLFQKHDVNLLQINDGDNPTIELNNQTVLISNKFRDLIYTHNDGIRNAGFAYVAEHGEPGDIIITLDDDCYPAGNDPIQEHLDILGTRHPKSWITTASEYMRGFPYGVRDEAEVLVSHGVWLNVPDLDAPTQLAVGVDPEGYYFPQTVVPKGIYFPFCIMNVAFRYEALPYMYQAPAGKNCPYGIDRFADIWCGINLVRSAAKHNFAIATGYSTIWHDRASNVFANLVKEAKGIGLNETYWQGEEKDTYFNVYNLKRKLWNDKMKTFLS